MHGLHHSLGFCKFKHILGQEEKRKKERLKSILQPACSAAPAVTRQIMPLKLVHGMLLTSRITETNSHFFHMLFVTHTNTQRQTHKTHLQTQKRDGRAANVQKTTENPCLPLNPWQLYARRQVVYQSRGRTNRAELNSKFCFRITPAQTCCVITTSDCAIYLFSDILRIFLFYFRKKFQVCERNMNVEEECSEQYFWMALYREQINCCVLHLLHFMCILTEDVLKKPKTL